MSKIKATSKLDFKINLELNESETRALEAIVGYGDKNFLKVFYEHMGKHYLEPHESGLKSLFNTIKEELRPHLYQIDNAKKALSNKIIIINATEYSVPYNEKLSHDRIAEIFFKEQYNPEYKYSITYTNGVNNSSGIIDKDSSIFINEGMIINCTASSKGEKR